MFGSSIAIRSNPRLRIGSKKPMTSRNPSARRQNRDQENKSWTVLGFLSNFPAHTDRNHRIVLERLDVVIDFVLLGNDVGLNGRIGSGVDASGGGADRAGGSAQAECGHRRSLENDTGID